MNQTQQVPSRPTRSLISREKPCLAAGDLVEFRESVFPRSTTAVATIVEFIPEQPGFCERVVLRDANGTFTVPVRRIVGAA